MGMAASQARFLSLTGRKSNTEYQGQQVNQQRTALANESANIYTEMSNLKVPTPPIQSNYYNTVYTITDNNSQQAKIIDWTLNNDTTTNNTNENGYKYLATVSYKDPYVACNKTQNASISCSEYDSIGGTVSISGLSASKYKVTELNEDSTIDNWDKLSAAVGETDKSKYVCLTSTNSDKGIVYYALKEDITNGSAPNLYSLSTEYADKEAQVLANFSQGSSNGRYTTVSFGSAKDSNGNEINLPLDGTMNLSYTKVENSDEYDSDYQNYLYEKDLYEKTIQDLNARTEKIQSKDKTLELKLKQLDTEQDALSQEMEAVQKVIGKNVETTFNTFG